MNRDHVGYVVLIAILGGMVGAVVLFSHPVVPPPVIVSLSYLRPGASAQSMDRLVAAPMIMRLRDCSDVEKITAISATGRTDIYLTAPHDASAAFLQVDVKIQNEHARGELPKDVAPTEPTQLPQRYSVPRVQPKLVERNFVAIDPQQAAAAGISEDEINQQMDKLPQSTTGGSAEKLAEAPIQLPNGKKIRLGDVAKVEKRSEPDTVVRTYP